MKINKSVTLNANSEIEGTIVANFYASVTSDGNGNTTNSMTIMDQKLYDANKKKVRADKRAFDDAVFEVEDDITEEEGV
ncbi:hypothetical protein OIT44_04010 [Weissella ceti]|uniref:Prophage protein n=1 Tax=Weissella ceti TaxID=759620 RepID=A0ABT3E4A3_9LACO|nr:hypothetical protein [Weissella ceti]MCW0953239.1 hypothetical protein [Weissella ceti]QVK12755.1 hypothetical protein KHQ31_03770 [Weissella ceti]